MVGTRVSIQVRLVCAVVCLSVIATGATGLLAWRSQRASTSAHAALVANGIADLLIGAAGGWALERGITLTALNTATSAGPETIASIGKQRASADEKSAAAIAAVANQPAASAGIARLRELQNGLTTLRVEVDAALAKPRASRPDGISARVFAALSDVTAAAQVVRRAAVADGNDVDALMIQLAQIKNATWRISEYAGRERANIGAIIASGKVVPQERLLELGENRGRVEASWVDVDIAVHRPGIPAPIQDAANRVRDTFFGQFQSLRERVYAAGMNDAAYPVDAATWVRQATAAIDTLLELSRAVGSETELIAMNSENSARTSSFVSLASLAGGLVIAVTTLLIATLQVARPLTRMARATRLLAAGELDAEIPCQQWHDELGTVSAAITVLRNGMSEKRELERVQAEAATIREQERERARLQAEREAAEAALVVETIGQALTQLAERDLCCSIETELPGDYDRLRTDLGVAVDELRTALLAVVDNADGIRANTSALSEASDDLSDRSQRQAASIEQAVASLAQLTTAVRATADGAMDVSVVIDKTKRDAEQSGIIVEQAVAIMDTISVSSRQIGEVTSIIDEMAFQTNLLALNAGVEAARAGDAGRGFAVVASEVRALAQRSAEAAKEIRTLIAASSKQVNTGVQLVGDAGISLNRIVGQVLQITGSVASIATAAKEQSQSLHEFNAAVTELERAANSDVALVEQANAAIHALGQDSVRLVELTRRFRLPDADAQNAPAPPHRRLAVAIR